MNPYPPPIFRKTLVHCFNGVLNIGSIHLEQLSRSKKETAIYEAVCVSLTSRVSTQLVINEFFQLSSLIVLLNQRKPAMARGRMSHNSLFDNVIG